MCQNMPHKIECHDAEVNSTMMLPLDRGSRQITPPDTFARIITHLTAPSMPSVGTGPPPPPILRDCCTNVRPKGLRDLVANMATA